MLELASRLTATNFRWSAGLTNREIFLRPVRPGLADDELQTLSGRKEASLPPAMPHCAPCAVPWTFCARAGASSCGRLAPPRRWKTSRWSLTGLDLVAIFSGGGGADIRCHGKPIGSFFSLLIACGAPGRLRGV